MKLIDIIILSVPLVTGFITSALFNVGKSAGASVKSRPPPIVFGIVWPILYLLIGLSWINSRNHNDSKITDIMYMILIFLLCLWIIVYKYNKKAALYVLLLCLTSTLFIIVYNLRNHIDYKESNKTNNSALLLIPLSTWLLFAIMLNNTEVNQS